MAHTILVSDLITSNNTIVTNKSYWGFGGVFSAAAVNFMSQTITAHKYELKTEREH